MNIAIFSLLLAWTGSWNDDIGSMSATELSGQANFASDSVPSCDLNRISLLNAPSLDGHSSGEIDDDGFQTIFNGESLEGWIAKPRECQADWSIVDGVIVGTGSENRLAYLMWHDDTLRNFELRLEYRLPEEGNTGIEIRSQADPSGKRPFQGYHADLGHIGIGDHILGAWDFHFATREEYPCPRGTRLMIDEQGRTTTEQIASPVLLTDIHDRDWNSVHIIAEDHRFRFFINGKLASEFIDDAAEGRLDNGAIALQIHDRGMKVEFRNVRLKVIE